MNEVPDLHIVDMGGRQVAGLPHLRRHMRCAAMLLDTDHRILTRGTSG